MFLRMVRAVLLNEKRNDVHEINVDLSPEKNEIYKILRGKATFLGQWEDELVVILKCRESVLDLKINENVLPRPFSNMEVMRPICKDQVYIFTMLRKSLI